MCNFAPANKKYDKYDTAEPTERHYYYSTA